MNDYLNNKNADYIEELSKRPEMSKWREEIKKDANKFYQFCVHYDLIPNIFVLHEVCAASTGKGIWLAPGLLLANCC